MPIKKLPFYRSSDQLPEYRNLDMAREIADYYAKGGELWRFPYFTQIYILHKVFWSSLSLTRKKTNDLGESTTEAMTSDYVTMNIFVVLMATVEYFIKGVAGKFISLLTILSVKHQHENEFDKLVGDCYQSYYEEIRKAPWFYYDFSSDLDKITQLYDALEPKDKTWGRYYTYLYLKLDWKAREALAPGIRDGFPDKDEKMVDSDINFCSDSDSNEIKAPVYDEFTEWLKNAYDDDYIHEEKADDKYSPPTQITQLWGHNSAICRMFIDKSRFEELREVFGDYILQSYGNGVDDDITVVLDIPWGEDAILKQFLNDFYDEEKKNIHFHDFYAAEDIYQRFAYQEPENTDPLKWFQASYFAPLAGLWVSRYYRIRPQYWLTRTLAVPTVFPVLVLFMLSALLIDITLSILGSILSLGYLMVSSINWMRGAKGAFESSSQSFLNNINCLGEKLYTLIRIPYAVFDPFYLAGDLAKDITKRFVVSGGGLFSSKTPICYPKNKDDLSILCQFARDNGKRIAIVGAGNSQGQQFQSHKQNQMVICLDQMEQPLCTMESDNTIAVCHPAARWSDIQDVIKDHAKALPVMQASNIFSVGGSVSTNVHGWNPQSGTLSNHIAAITYMDENGQEHTANPGDEMFQNIVGGFGRHAVITSVKLRVIDNTKVQLKGKKMNLSRYFKHFKKNILSKEDGLHIGRLPIDKINKWGDDDCMLISSDWEASDDNNPVADKTLIREKKNGPMHMRILLNLMTHFPFMKKLYWKLEEAADCGENPEMTLNETMNFPIEAMMRNPEGARNYWLYEAFIDDEPTHGKIQRFTKQLGKILDKNKVNLINASLRYVPAEKQTTAMPYAPKDRWALVFCWRQDMKQSEVDKTSRWVRQINDLTIDCEGSFYLPYQPYATRDQIVKSYPSLEAMQPKEGNIFENGLGDRLLGQSLRAQTQESTDDPIDRYKHRSIDFIQELDKMKGFFDVVFTQIGYDDFRQIYEDTLTEGYDSDQSFYEAVQKKVMAKVSMIGQVGALRSLQSDLADQAVELYNKAHKSGENDRKGKMLEMFTYGRHAVDIRSRLKTIDDLDVWVDTGVAFDRMKYAVETRNPMAMFGQLSHINTYHLDMNDPSQNQLDGEYEMITCFAGMHHFPEDQANKFIEDITRHIKPGGVFLLMEHDAYDDDIKFKSAAAHSIFSVSAGESYDEYSNELRNFDSVEHWIERVEGQGALKVIRDEDGNPCKHVRDGDPTLNTMIGFVKTSS